MKNKGTKILIVVLIILILAAGGVMAYKIINDKKNKTQEVSENQNEDILTAKIEKKEVQIFKGNDRPIAVMIDNHNLAWPQAVLNKAYSAMSKRKNGIYFLGSRRSLIVPSLFENSSIERISELLQSSASRITYSDVLKKIGLDIETVKSAKLDLESFNFEKILDRNTLTNNQEFIDFYNKIRQVYGKGIDVLA